MQEPKQYPPAWLQRVQLPAHSLVAQSCDDQCGPSEGLQNVTPSISVYRDLTVAQILGPTGASGRTTIFPYETGITGCVYLDGNAWKIRVLSAYGTIHWGALRESDGYHTEPTDTNINCGNVVDAITIMGNYTVNQGSGAWHIEAATVAHEEVHVDWYLSDYFSSANWNPIETEIRSKVLGYCPQMTQMQAIAEMDDYLNEKESDWRQAMATSLPAPEAPGFAAGQAVLNLRINELIPFMVNCP